MDWNKHRVLIASALLMGLVGTLVYLERQRAAEYAAGSEPDESPLPSVIRGQITSVEISRPSEEAVRLVKTGETFRLAAPVDYPADEANVSSLLDKLGELEFVSVASRSASSHALLEVDDAQGIRVVAKAGDRTVADFRIGVYRGGNTMIRLEGSNDVVAVRGSLRYAFAREVREWRDRIVTELPAADVKWVSFASDQGTFRFERDASGTFAPVGAAIPRFQATKVDGIVTALARLRATDFATADETAAANLAAPRATVTLHLEIPAGDAGAARSDDIVLLLGSTKASTNDVYVQRVGNPTIYVGSSTLDGRMRPTLSSFQEAVAVDGGVPAAPEPTDDAMGGTAGDLPPEVLQQLLQRAQQGGH